MFRSHFENISSILEMMGTTITVSSKTKQKVKQDDEDGHHSVNIHHPIYELTRFTNPQLKFVKTVTPQNTWVIMEGLLQ